MLHAGRIQHSRVQSADVNVGKAAQLSLQCAGEAPESRLAGRVGGAIWHGQPAAYRNIVDQHAIALLLKVRQHRSSAIQVAKQVYLYYARADFGGRVFKGSYGQHAGIIDPYVNSSVAKCSGLHGKLLMRNSDGHIRWHGKRMAAQAFYFGNQLLQCSLPPRGNHHPCALPGKAKRRRPAYAAGGACYNNCLSPERGVLLSHAAARVKSAPAPFLPCQPVPEQKQHYCVSKVNSDGFNFACLMKYVLSALLLLAGFTPAFAQKPSVSNPYAALDKRALQIPDSLTKTTIAIARYVAANFKSDSEQTRAVFAWMANHIEYDLANMYAINFYEKSEEKIAKVLSTRRGICDAYAATFAEILNKLGIKSFVVEGYTKQAGFADYIPHAWCAALVGG